MPISSYSATMIGHGQSDIQRHHIVSSNYKNEAKEISKHISKLHPSRSNKTMQIQYPSTINKLSSNNSETNLQSFKNNMNNNNSTTTTTLRPSTVVRSIFHFFLYFFIFSFYFSLFFSYYCLIYFYFVI